MNDGASLVLAAAVLVALAIDRYCGEPPARWHPVVWMGHYLNWIAAYVTPAGSRAALNPRDIKAFGLGALAVASCVARFASDSAGTPAVISAEWRITSGELGADFCLSKKSCRRKS